METQFIKLNMTPMGVTPCFHVSQYDIGRPLGFIVYNGSEVVDLDNYTCTIEATRSDGVAITASVATDDNVGTFATTATMTNKADKYKAQFVIVDGDSNRIASLPFDMDVVKAAMDENAESIEEDASLYQQYTEAVQGAIAEANADIQAEENARIAAVNAEENARIAAVNAEATTRANADATLQNNIDAEATARANAINAEASARQTADNTLQGNINSEASTRASADSNLQSQINQIIAPSGEAPSAAEVQNARIGADGFTYDTLGNAIRGQVTDLKSALNIPEYWTGNQLEYGYIDNTGTLHNDPNGNRQRTDYIPITPSVEISYIGENNNAYINAISFYDKYGYYISGDSNSGILGEYSIVTTPSNAYFARISTIKDINWKAEIKRSARTRSASYTTLERIAAAEDDIETINNNVINSRNTVYDKENIVDFVGKNGTTTQSGLTITQDYNYITINGVYTLSARRRFNLSGELENTASAVPQSWCANVIGKLESGKLYSFTVKTVGGSFLAAESVQQPLNIQCFDTNGISIGLNAYLLANGSFSTTTIKTASDINIGCVALTINKDVTLNDYKIFVVISEITANTVAYIDAKNGNDLNTGSKTSPYKTINKALANDATTIFVKPGIYNEKINVSGGELNIMPWIDAQAYSSTEPFRPKIIITNGTPISVSQDLGNIYKATYMAETDSNIYKVFVSKTLDPVTQGSYSLEYNAMLIGNKPSSGTKGTYKQRLYTPVLTEEELTEQGTFWYDGTNQIKFHPWDNVVDDFYIIPNDDADVGLNLENMESVHIEDVRIIGFYENCAYIKRSDNVTILCSDFGLCGKGMGLRLDNTNARVSDCHAFGCSTDGFNLHEYGYSEFYGCTSFYNGDDGISHHQGCTGIIEGGEWAYNGSGGITPAFGCQIEVKNTYCHNNSIGLQYFGQSGQRRNVRCSGNLLIDNTQSDLYSNYYDLVAYNNAYRVKEVGAYGTITEYNSTILS